MENLTREELLQMIPSVFPKSSDDKKLAILVDLPHEVSSDNPDWLLRRKIAESWYQLIKDDHNQLGLEEISLVAYADVGSNNADLPANAYIIEADLPLLADQLEQSGELIGFDQVFANYQLFMAPTEFSTTAPLKIAAKKHGFRAATMPGFSPKMLPALKINYQEVNRRVTMIKTKLDRAIWAKVKFIVDQTSDFNMLFDLRFRKGHISSGRFPLQGTAGNFPSGESYIVPYEGEFEENSMTGGIMPVQIKDEVVLFIINENRAFSVDSFPQGSKNSAVDSEMDHLRREPAYGNIAELGFGVLGDFGLHPIQEILLDEKLGFHIAFGRSDHFGGIIGPKNFSSPKEVIHLDYIYIPATQPRITVESIELSYEDSNSF